MVKIIIDNTYQKRLTESNKKAHPINQMSFKYIVMYIF